MLGGHDARDARDGEDVAFLQGVGADEGAGGRVAECDVAGGEGGAVGGGFVGDGDLVGLGGCGVEVGEVGWGWLGGRRQGVEVVEGRARGMEEVVVAVVVVGGDCGVGEDSGGGVRAGGWW